MDNENEQVIAVPKKLLFVNKSFTGFRPFCYERYWDIVKDNQEIISHQEIENNDNYLQPIIVMCVYRPGRQTLFYFKKQDSTNQQEWSIAVEGHIAEIPQIPYSLQELGMSFFQKKFLNRYHYSVRPLGYLYSPEHEQTKNHLGLLFLANIDAGLQVCCPKLFKSATVDKNQVKNFIYGRFPFDPWTKMAFNAIQKDIYYH